MVRTEGEPRHAETAPQQKLDATMQVLEQGIDSILSGEGFARYLNVLARFHHYSFGNVMLIQIQKPEATRVAGYRRWQELGRQVRKGEHGISILVPHKLKLPKENEDEESRVIVRGYGVGNVFDVSQTDGEPLPEPPVVREVRESSEPGRILFNHLNSFLESKDIALIRGNTRPALGYWEPTLQRIVLDMGLDGDQATKTLAHETAHFVAGHQPQMDRRDAETIAESAAYVVLSHYGIDSSEYSFPYVARWGKDREVLKRNLSAIQSTAHQMLDGIGSLTSSSTDEQMPLVD
jgi:antirestriction protein ArdC